MKTKNLSPFLRSLLIAFFFLLFSFFSLHASPYDMILVGDPVIEDIRFLSLETGIAVLSFTPPFAPGEIENFLNKINEDKLSEAGMEAYNRLRERLNPKTPLSLTWEKTALLFNVESALEVRARTNEKIDYPDEPKIPAFLSLPVRFHFTDIVQLYLDPAVSIDPQDYSYGSHSSSGYISNNILMLNGNHINGNSPLRTFLAMGGDWWNFQLGRDRLSYGTGITGNLGIADNPPFYEFMRLSFFADYLKYSLLVIQSPLHVNTKNKNTNNPNNQLIDNDIYPDINNLFDNGLMDKNTERYFYIHRLDFSFFDRVSIGLMEGVIANSGMEIRLLNPLMILHNAMTWRDYNTWSDDFEESFMIGSFFSAEINWNIVRSLSFKTQFVMNELAIGPETGEGRSEAPNGLGFMAGLQYGFTFRNWSALAYLESFYTFPFLGINRSPYSSYIYMNMIGFVHDTYYYYWFGYPRDTFSISAGIKTRNLHDKIGFDMGFSWIASGQKNENGVIWDYDKTQENYNLTSPSGIVENRFILSTGAKWDVYSWLTLQAKLSGMYYMNNGHVEGENAFNGQISLSTTFRY